MRTFLDVVRFERRLQLRSPLFHGVLLLFFAIHLLTMSQSGIHLSDNELINVNSAYLIFRTELVLSAFGMLPAIIFVVGAATRDHERKTVEWFYATPVGKWPFVLGRFTGGALGALSVGLAGVVGTAAGTFMPWLDPARVAPFRALPYVVSFGLIVVPSLLVFSAIAFGVAILSRSTALSCGVAMAFVVIAVVVNTLAASGGPGWLALLDPTGALPVEAASRYWSVHDLNTRLPLTLVPANRLAWLALALIVLLSAVRRVRLELPTGAVGRPAPRSPWSEPVVEPPTGTPDRGPRWRTAAARLGAQLETELRAVFLSPLSALVLVLVAIATVSEARSLVGPIQRLPLHPQTALMLGFFRFGLFQFVLMLLIFYSGTLVHREREYGLHEIVSASPHPDWLPIVSKTAALCAAIVAVLLVSMVTSVAWQLRAGHRDLELGVYARGLFVYNGFYFAMLAVLAIVIQVLSPGKWSGMVLVGVVYAGLLSLESLGFEDLLYGFRIPYVVYSDMNGFGHFQSPTVALTIYWALGCAVLVVLAQVAWPRGYYARTGERVRDAWARLSGGAVVATLGAATAFAAVGGWIFYNTHVLNRYETVASRLQQRADYERRFAAFRDRPGPSLVAVALEVDFYPGERRLESRGTATLRNRQGRAIDEFVISVDPRLSVRRLEVPGAAVVDADRTQGFYRLRVEPALPPDGVVTLGWEASRLNPGFVNSGADTEVVANGSFVDLQTVMPIAAYDDAREIADAGDRARHGLPPAARLPALGDPRYLNTIGLGIDGRVDFRAILSTAADQTAVAPGALVRQWSTAGRRYFEYVVERPIWPSVSLSSARYAVSRDTWSGVSLEVYHDAKHAWNVQTMLQTARRALAYFSREFAPYPYSSFRIVEFPRYRSQAQAFPGTVPYSESVGFLTDTRGWASLDYTTIHELAHQWWGGMAYGARMQGRQMLNETLAQYSTLMVFKAYEQPRWLRQILAATADNYLRARSLEAVAEQPLVLTEDQGNVSYNKGALAMFALQERVGEAAVNGALRAYLAKFAMRPPPFPTSRDLVHELRAVAGPPYQALVTDLFEKIVLYDVRLDSATARPASGGGFDVTLDIEARQVEADGHGVETDVPLDTWFDVVVLPESSRPLAEQTPIYQAAHRLHSGPQRLTVRVPTRPGAAGVDPFHVMIDLAPADNTRAVTMARAN